MLRIIITITTLLSITAFAKEKDTRYIQPKLTNNDDLAFNCPELKNLQVYDKGDASFINIQINSIGTSLKTTGESKTCYSDMLCPTFVSFGTEKHYSKIVLTRNNDGNYPTTNLEGFSDLTFDLSETPRFGSYYCRYDLSVAY